MIPRRPRRNIKLPDGKPKAPPPPAVVEMACICGQLLRLKADTDDEKRCACPVCLRKFLMTFIEEKGRLIASPVYLDDTMSTGETHLAEAPGAVSRAPKGKGVVDDALGASPPDDLVCVCPQCSTKMRVKKTFYDKRAKCPKCPARLLLTVVYDPTTKVHSIQPLRVTDAPSGDTWHPGA